MDFVDGEFLMSDLRISQIKRDIGQFENILLCEVVQVLIEGLSKLL